MECSRPLIFPGESRDKLPQQGEKGGAYASSAPRLRLFFIASLVEAAGHKTFGFARFTRGSRFQR